MVTLAGARPSEPWLTERKSLLPLREDSISNKLKSPLLQGPDRHLMGEQAVGFQIRRNHLHRHGEGAVGIGAAGSHLRLHGVAVKNRHQLIALHLPPRIGMPLRVISSVNAKGLPVNVKVWQNQILKFFRGYLKVMAFGAVGISIRRELFPMLITVEIFPQIIEAQCGKVLLEW